MNERNPQDRQMIAAMRDDAELQELAARFMEKITAYRYSYNFTWLGRPIIQYPPDMIALQEIIWSVKPDVIIETGVAHGGSLIFHASILELLGGERNVIGVDIEIREHNRAAIETHPLAARIVLLEGSSVDDSIVSQVRELAAGKRCLVILDSNHTHDHVARELEIYSRFVTRDSYLVVFDTVIENLPDSFYADRPWSRGDNPATAVREFLATNDRFAVDRDIEDKLVITVAPGGYLRCLRD